jgi:uncharacterized protein YecT (DUF1311 family)
MKRWLLMTVVFCTVPVWRVVLAEDAEGAADAPATEEDRRSFADADRDMNKAWAKAISGLDKASLRKLKGDQNIWLKYRRRFSISPMYLGTRVESEKEIEGLAAHFAALTALTADRTEWLAGISEPLPKDGSVEGRWTDSYGGTMELVEEGTQLHFAFRVVRGDTFHDGSICGTASWNGRTGIFTDRDRPDSAGEAVIVFVLRGNQLEVVGERTSEYHGNAATFDGDYARVGDLDELRRKALLEEVAEKSARKKE